jgi:hypothetical protein
MVRTDAGVVSPRRESAEEGAQHHARKRKDGGDEGASPASPEVSELGDGLGKNNLVGVALKVAENGGAENGGDDDDAEKRGADVVERVGVCGIQQDLPVAVADGAETFRSNGEK